MSTVGEEANTDLEDLYLENFTMEQGGASSVNLSGIVSADGQELVVPVRARLRIESHEDGKKINPDFNEARFVPGPKDDIMSSRLAPSMIVADRNDGGRLMMYGGKDGALPVKDVEGRYEIDFDRLQKMGEDISKYSEEEREALNELRLGRANSFRKEGGGQLPNWNEMSRGINMFMGNTATAALGNREKLFGK